MSTDIIITARPNSRKHKKGRKHGRKGRRPGHKRYNEEKRWLRNKAKRVLKCNGEAAWVAYCELHNLH